MHPFNIPSDLAAIAVEIEICQKRLTEAYRELRRGFSPDSAYCAGIYGAANKEDWASMVAGTIEGLAGRLQLLADRKASVESASAAG